MLLDITKALLLQQNFSQNDKNIYITQEKFTSPMNNIQKYLEFTGKLNVL